MSIHTVTIADKYRTFQAQRTFLSGLVSKRPFTSDPTVILDRQTDREAGVQTVRHTQKHARTRTHANAHTHTQKG